MSGVERAKPAIDEMAALETLRRAYGFHLERLRFLTAGWASYIYVAETAGAEVYLLKVYDESLPSPMLATSRDFYLPLTYQLWAKGLLPEVARPIQTLDGQFSTKLDNHLFIMFHYIDGQAVGFGNVTPGILTRLAGLVGRLHANTAKVDLPNPMVEDFRVSFQDTLPQALDELANPPPDDRPGWAEFQALLLPRREEILGHLGRLLKLQDIMKDKRARADMVVCHADLHGGNLMIDQGGTLHIIDWEGAILAPPEQDLFFFAGEDTFGDLFWPNYKHEFPGAGLDLDTLGFYYYRRGLEDLAEWLQRLLHAPQASEQVNNALHYAGETLKDLDKIEITLGRIGRNLLHLR